MKYYAYRHISGALHLKKYFGPHDIEECWESPFVKDVFGPFEADNQKDAWQKIDALRLRP